MNSRMEKYYDVDPNLPKRTDKNASLYKEINQTEIDKFKLNSNVSVLESNNTSIDIEELKTILDKKYTNPPQRRSIFIDTEEETAGETPETTKEYDINAILEKAREEKEEDYEEERFKKISDTQLDILKSLTISDEEEVKENLKIPAEEDLMTLINTISARELENATKLNPLDILTDLKGSEDTEVLGPMSETKRIDTSFYTNSVEINKNDLEETSFETEKSEPKKPIIWIITVIAILAFLIGLVIIINKYFNLGLF